MEDNLRIVSELLLDFETRILEMRKKDLKKGYAILQHSLAPGE